MLTWSGDGTPVDGIATTDPNASVGVDVRDYDC